MEVRIVMVAGGSGKRMGSTQPKQFLQLEEAPIIIHSLRKFLEWSPSLIIALVLPEGHFSTFGGLSEKYLKADEASRIVLCKGGDSRTASVWAGIQRLFETTDKAADTLVGIHDGVRPFVKESTLDKAFSLAEEREASVVCVPVKASIRKKLPNGDSEAVDRKQFFEVQTPQVFRLDKIYRAFSDRPHDHFTDDASLYQFMGGKVAICTGSYDNIKITSPEDLSVGREILLRQQPNRP